MQLTCADDLEWKPLTQIRDGGKDAKELLVGTEGTPDNYRLVMVREQGVVANTPRHKHTFDQVRIVLSGRANYGPQRWIEPGELAYFPEGTPYGPEASDGDRLGLTLQCGGASGLGFLSNRQLKAGTAELQQTGEFKGGVYYPGSSDGKRRAQDAYEAVWEHINGRKIDYPKPRYDEPIKMRPGHFEWQDQPGQPGVQAKLLGVFTERRHEIAMLRLGVGSTAMLGPRAGIQLAYVLQGAAAIDGRAASPNTAFEVTAGSAAQVIATSAVELIVIGLPIFVTAKQPSSV